MSNRLTLDYIKQLIDNQIPESLELDYKAANSLAKDNDKPFEISKDVSAMANSAGGTIIYGVREVGEKRPRLLTEIDPVDQTKIPKEWLERVIGDKVRPRIQGVIIHPVRVSQNLSEVVYVVEIPKSTTAHQASDLRYYRRYNFESAPMYDHEVRDVMARSQHPRVVLEFAVKKPTKNVKKYRLIVTARNVGVLYAMYVNCFIEIPVKVLPDHYEKGGGDYFDFTSIEGVECYSFVEKNTRRDLIRTDYTSFDMPKEELGPVRYEPILPGLVHDWIIELNKDFESKILPGISIRWVVYADNSPPIHGTTPLIDISVL